MSPSIARMRFDFAPSVRADDDPFNGKSLSEAGRVSPHSLRPTADLNSVYEKNNCFLPYHHWPCVDLRLRL